MSFRVIAAVMLALAVAVGVGWAVGASGRAAIEVERNRSDLRAEVAEARGLIMEGRVDLFLQNFGNAIQHFQQARDLVGRVQSRLREQGLADQAGRLEIVLSHLSDAQHLSATFDAHAQTPAEEALTTLDAVRKGG